jgi:hypothetical protein
MINILLSTNSMLIIFSIFDMNSDVACRTTIELLKYASFLYEVLVTWSYVRVGILGKEVLGLLETKRVLELLIF